jgi:hypothetical protein
MGIERLILSREAQKLQKIRQSSLIKLIQHKIKEQDGVPILVMDISANY